MFLGNMEMKSSIIFVTITIEGFGNTFATITFSSTLAYKKLCRSSYKKYVIVNATVPSLTTHNANGGEEN